MEVSFLAPATARALRAQIAMRRGELVAAVLRGSGGTAQAPFGHDFLVRLEDELATGERAPTDEWAASLQSAAGADDLGARLVVACAAVASSVRPGPAAAAISAYLALRGRELDRVCERALTDRGEGAVSRRLVERSEVVGSLLTTLAARDPATCHHSQAVGTWAERVARAFDMTDTECEFVELSGTLHDVGKVSTPRRILLKPGPLDADEWEVMREHSAVGARILESIPSLRACAPIVRSHHERIDGRGYPDGLAGEGIPLAARIVAVADSFHAMISRRSYRPAMPAGQAIAILQEGSGSRWDRRVVAVMVGVVRPARARQSVAATGARSRSNS